ncbi:MAG: cyclophilin-like fold protein [Candidatus Hodarchaeota archaeon]
MAIDERDITKKAFYGYEKPCGGPEFMDTLKVRIDKEVFEIDVSGTTSPKTLEILKPFLPFKIELHYAKVAGEEVMGMMPFHTPLEREIEVAQARPGMLVYWPPRQLLCFFYGKMQPESAHVNVLGYLKNDLEKFASYGESVRKDQGKKLHYCDVYIGDPYGEFSPVCPKHYSLDYYEQEIWLKMPEEIKKIIAKQGIMRPAGLILYAETDTRVFHEFLSMTRDKVVKNPRNLLYVKKILMEYLNYFHNKMLGWYALEKTAFVIKRYMESFDKSDSSQSLISLLSSVTLFIGRINMWLDALILWDDINENMKSTRPSIIGVE